MISRTRMRNLVDVAYGIHEGLAGDLNGGDESEGGDLEPPYVLEPDLGKRLFNNVIGSITTSCFGLLRSSVPLPSHNLTFDSHTSQPSEALPTITKLPIEFNEDGVVVGPNHAKWNTQVGVYVRARIPIHYKDWRKIDGSFKDNVWNKLMTDNDELSKSLGLTKGVEHVESAPTSLRSNCNVYRYCQGIIAAKQALHPFEVEGEMNEMKSSLSNVIGVLKMQNFTWFLADKCFRFPTIMWMGKASGDIQEEIISIYGAAAHIPSHPGNTRLLCAIPLYAMYFFQLLAVGWTLHLSFDYLFYVDFEASMANPNSQNALRHLEEFATFLRVLGSYPADNRLKHIRCSNTLSGVGTLMVCLQFGGINGVCFYTSRIFATAVSAIGASLVDIAGKRSVLVVHGNSTDDRSSLSTISRLHSSAPGLLSTLKCSCGPVMQSWKCRKEGKIFGVEGLKIYGVSRPR
ncbi:hypothetical protein IFM89_027322 [Coptis chinensis]|uniref:Uncharacterized protein n=1 Tax=Coptis chinensis TaxID=261450 RepID=A0A835HHD0_9MAGN|nr:hypothetical protein IFM89_027322 [Coptis chinensis]